MSMMHDCNQLNQALLQWMSRCPNPWPIDRESGDLSQDQLGPDPLLHYIRYDVELDASWLKENLDLSFTPKRLAEIRQFDRPDLSKEWLEIGRRSAEKQVSEEHFPLVFDEISRP